MLMMQRPLRRGLSYAARLPDEPEMLGQRLTGVLRELRGRGIARQLKQAVTGYALAHGYRRVRTATLQANPGMQ